MEEAEALAARLGPTLHELDRCINSKKQQKVKDAGLAAAVRDARGLAEEWRELLIAKSRAGTQTSRRPLSLWERARS